MVYFTILFYEKIKIGREMGEMDNYIREFIKGTEK